MNNPRVTYVTSRDLVIEFHKRADGGLEAVLSLPGRSGTVTRVCGGRTRNFVTAPELADFTAWVAQAVGDWAMLAGTVQEAFPGL